MATANSTEHSIHIDDVVVYLKSCSDTFGQIAAILNFIERDCPEESDLRKLAAAGYRMASDHENQADYWREEVEVKGVRMATKEYA